MQVIDGRPGSQHCVKIRGEPERDDNELRYRICVSIMASVHEMFC